MSQITLAVKYRPNSWEDMSGQDSIKVILDEQLRNGTFKNGYLFSGASGCGKIILDIYAYLLYTIYEVII